MIGTITNANKKHLNALIEECDFLGDISITWGLMEIPSVNITLPATYAKYLSGNSIVNIKSDDWVFEGYVEKKNLNTNDSTVTVSLAHILNKFDKKTLPTNITLKRMTVEKVVEHAYASLKNELKEREDVVKDFTMNFVDSYGKNYEIEYEFSNESFLEFFTKVCEKTHDLYWRVNRYKPYQIDFGVFGKHKNVLINETNLLVSLDGVEEDYSEVTNVAVAMSDKSDSGASSLTLRDIFYNPQYMVNKFPVFMTGRNVNSQRHYEYPQIPQFAPEIIGDEFAVMDEEGIALEAGEVYWGTVTTNDIQAVSEDNTEITNADRINATVQLYNTAIRQLKNSRRKLLFPMTVEPLPYRQVQLGDKVMFNLDMGVWELTNCSSYYEKVLRESDWFYVTEMVDEYTPGNAYVQKLVLSKYLYSERDTTTTT